MISLLSNIEVVAITTVSGNTSEENVYRNVKEILRLCNKEVPIYRGSDRPLINLPSYCNDIHGDDGLNGYWSRHSDQYFPADIKEKAANAIVRLSKENPDIGIICIGPLTNLALAFLIDSISFKEISIMGGTIDSIGNVTQLAEFNIYQDPEAAYIVFERAQRLLITPWETTALPELLITEDEFEELRAGGIRGQFLCEVFNKNRYLCDLIAAAVAICPEIITEFQDFPASVELSGKYSRGLTVVMKDGKSLSDVKLKRFRFIRNVDRARLISMIKAINN